MYYLTLLMNKYSKSKKKKQSNCWVFLKVNLRVYETRRFDNLYTSFQAAVEPFSCLAAYSAILSSSIGLKWRINP